MMRLRNKRMQKERRKYSGCGTTNGDQQSSRSRGFVPPQSGIHVIIALVLFLLLPLGACSHAGHPPTLASPKTTPSSPNQVPPNIVVIITDDQRADTLWAMPAVQELVDRGVRFTSAYTTIPICCPFRASLLAGGLYTHNTNVLTNQWPNGGAERFDDSVTLATQLSHDGYRTALFGKYMNGLANIAPRIPGGWTQFAANITSSNWPERSWSDFYALEGTRWPDARRLRSSSEGDESGFFTHVTEYSPYFYRNRALSFVEKAAGAPFFLYLALRAPHMPATPDPDDAGLFGGFEYSGRAYGEADLDDKPAWVRFEAQRFQQWRRSRGDLPRRSLRSLQAVDRVVRSIYAKLEQLGELDRTWIFFTSDSGFHWLEHRLSNKGSPYEEALRVPLIVVGPSGHRGVDDHLVEANVDIGATIFELAGIEDARTDGESLLPHVSGPKASHPGRNQIFFEQFGLEYRPDVRDANPDRPFTGHFFAGLRVRWNDRNLKYVEHYSGETELYDLDSDPYEEHSKHDDPEYAEIAGELSDLLRPLKGLAITDRRLPPATVGKPYRFALSAVGGQQPYQWRLITDRLPGIQTNRHIGPALDGLPPGLQLDGGSGTIEGTPEVPGRWNFVIQVRDSSTSHRSGGHQSYYGHFAVMVEER